MQTKKSKSVIRLIDEARLRTLIYFAAGVNLLFAITYWLSGSLRFSSGGGVDFPNCLYMSLVTFTTLGYGDIIPVGVAKPLACVEVVLGLTFVGICIAKLTSASQSYYLGQLYARDAQERFESYLVDLRKLRDQYREIARHQDQGAPIQRSLGASHSDARKLLSRIRDYASFEINQGDLLRKMPIGPIAHILRTCFQLVPTLEKTANFPKSQHSQKQRRMAIALVAQIEDLSNLVSNNSDDISVRSEAAKLNGKCLVAKGALNSRFQEIVISFKKLPSAKTLNGHIGESDTK